MPDLTMLRETFDKSEDHIHRWKTVGLLKREGKGKERSVHFMKKCRVCEKKTVKVFYPAVYLEMYKLDSKASGKAQATDMPGGLTL